jgi:ABC-type multidrug transport system ATPase subunit
VLLDEPTTGLDPRSRIALWDAIRTLVANGTDILLTTQYLEEADQLAGQIVIVDRGRAVATGSAAELKRRVGGSVVEVHARRTDDLAAIAAALGRLGEAQVEDATRRVVAPVDRVHAPLTAALHALEDAGVEIADVTVRQPTLDEVFLALTGEPAAA